MEKRSSTQLNCFSPPVMIATMVIEVCLAIYTLWRYKLDSLGRLVVLTLSMLASFQLAEYFVCTGSVGHAQFWSRVGFATITVLPPLGLHILHVLAGKKDRTLVQFVYGTMIAFIGIFLFVHGAFENHECTGNYVIFHIRPHIGGLYWFYYFGWIGISVILAVKWMRELKKTGKKVARQVQAIEGLTLSWLVFIVPTALANAVNARSRQGIPSIMCGFAVLFALILTLYVLPRAGERKARI
jgi:hypothetical protein